MIIKFNEKRTKILYAIAWLAIAGAWLFMGNASTFEWASEKGGITQNEFHIFGALQFMVGLLLGMAAVPLENFIKCVKATK